MYEDWAPLGARRFLELVRSGFFSSSVALFRVVPNFLVQFGVAGDPGVTQRWRGLGAIADDPHWLRKGEKFERGWLSFAGSGANSRTTQMFITLKDSDFLGKAAWEVPFARVVRGMDVVDSWHSGYGEMEAFGGHAPDQHKIAERGVAYLRESFPDIDYITSCAVSEAPRGDTSALPAIEGAGDAEVDRPYPAFWRPPAGASDQDVGFDVGGQPSIYVKIASYRDYQCPQTVEEALAYATHPQRIFFGIVEQNAPGDVPCGAPAVPCSQDPSQRLCDAEVRRRVRVYRMDAQKATGPVTARHVGDRMYRGESFVLQVDAHTSFALGWDEDLISQLKRTGNDYAVLSTYPTDIKGPGGRGAIDEAHMAVVKTTPVMCNTHFENGVLRHLSQPETFPPRKLAGTPILQPFWAAGVSFSRGHFVVNVPYDCCLPMLFQGEEIAIAVRGFTHGYDFYAPDHSVVFHHYKRKKAPPLFWENSGSHRGEEKRSRMRVKMITELHESDFDRTTFRSVDDTEMERYGLGDKRPVEWFYDAFGIDREAKTVVEGLCSFSQTGDMNRKYAAHRLPYGNVDYAAVFGDMDHAQRLAMVTEAAGAAFAVQHPRKAALRGAAGGAA